MRIRPVILLLCIAVAAASCHKDKAAGADATPRPITFSVNAPDYGTKVMVGENVGIDDLRYYCTPREDTYTFEGSTHNGNKGLGKAIGIWADMTVQATGQVIKDVYDGVELKWFERANGHEYHPDGDEETNRSYWNTNGDVYWRQGEEYVFRAYYPAGTELKENTSATSFISEYNAERTQEDLMVAYTKVETTTTTLDKHVDLNFKHMLSAVMFRFRFKKDFKAEDYLTSMWIENTSKGTFHNYGFLIFGDGTEAGAEDVLWRDVYAPEEGMRIYEWASTPGIYFNNTGTAATAYVPDATVTKGDIFTEAGGWVFMIPQDLHKGTEICFTTKNGMESVFRTALPHEFKITGTEEVISEFVAGYRYIIDIVITQLNVDAYITIKPWNELQSSYSLDF